MYWEKYECQGAYMKIKIKELSYDKVMGLPERIHHKPVRKLC
jgi:hypothetical protein